MKSDIELLGVENYPLDNSDRIIRSLKLILVGLSRDTPVSLCGQLYIYVDCTKVVKPIGIFNYWYKYRIEDIPENERYKFYWYPLTLEFNEVRAKLLEKVISEFEKEFLK